MKEIVKISGKEQSLPDSMYRIHLASDDKSHSIVSYFTVSLGHFKTYLCQFELSYTLLGNYVTRIKRTHLYYCPNALVINI